MTENNNRAVITGLGMICAIGNSVDEAWNNAINSVSGIHKTTTLDTTDCYADLQQKLSATHLEILREAKMLTVQHSFVSRQQARQ